MIGQLIDGTAIAAKLRAEVAISATALRERGIAPTLAVVLVGDDPASAVYVKAKTKAAREANVDVRDHKLPATTSQAELMALVAQLNADPAVDGILVQLPLPDHIDERVVTTRIDPDKDVDGFHPVNAGRLATGLYGFVPCTPLGCLMLLKDQLGDLAGLDAVVIGRSNIVGKPMAQLLIKESCTVTVAHSRTKDLSSLVRRADIVVAAVGRPEMIKGDWIKPGATVIDVGINRPTPLADGSNGGLVGDVDFAGAMQVAGAVTPVPGGVGPMTIACLLRNTLVSAHRRARVSYDKDAM